MCLWDLQEAEVFANLCRPIASSIADKQCFWRRSSWGLVKPPSVVEKIFIRVTQAMKEAYKITLPRVKKASEEVFLYITLCGSSEVLVFVF